MNESAASEAFDLLGSYVGLDAAGRLRRLEHPPGPPPRIEGFTIGAHQMDRDAPHGGERHPDGDELLFLVSGRAEVVLEEEGGERRVALGPGCAFVVPKGVWHNVRLLEPTLLVHLTPGPGGDHRPMSASEGARR
jgi:mannose-6-phosphate isomerase-like protein (cupin superfamily)